MKLDLFKIKHWFASMIAKFNKVKGGTIILCYHSVSNDKRFQCDNFNVSIENFKEQMELIKSTGLPVVSLDDIGKYPEAIAITFDDGYGSVYTHALPILINLNFPFTVYVVSNWINTHDYLNERQLINLSNYASIGAHSLNHLNLNKISLSEANDEILQSKNKLEQIIEKSKSFFFSLWR